MVGRIRPALGLALGFGLALTAAGQARAQYGYGSYGWGGWGGGGSTIQGNVARGLGYYDIGAGVYNLDTAEANSINTDSVLRWNQYMWNAQLTANHNEHLRMARRLQRDAASGDAYAKKVTEDPTPEDIADGNALNAALAQLNDPRMHGSALRLANDKIPGKLIRAIPFVNASEAVTICLDELTAEEGWPIGLSGPTFADERKAYSAAVDKALAEDREGDIRPETLQSVNDSLARLRAKLQANPSADRAQLGEAQHHIRTLAGMTRMLQRPDVDKVVAQLDKIKETTLGSLLAFMHAYNLRFGRPTTAEQRAAYEALYPIVDAHRDRVVSALKDDKKATARTSTDRSRYHPGEFLSPLELEETKGKDKAKAKDKTDRPSDK